MNGRVYDNGQSPDVFQTNLLYIINGEVIEFAKDNECPDNFSPCHKHWNGVHYLNSFIHNNCCVLSIISIIGYQTCEMCMVIF